MKPKSSKIAVPTDGKILEEHIQAKILPIYSVQQVKMNLGYKIKFTLALSGMRLL